MATPRQIPLTEHKNDVPPVPKNTPESNDDAVALLSGRVENNELDANVAALSLSDPSDATIDFSDYEGIEYAEDAWYLAEENAIDHTVVDEGTVEEILLQMIEGDMSLDEVLLYRDAISNATRSEIERRYHNQLQGARGQDEVIEVANVAALPSPSLVRAIATLFSGITINNAPQQHVGEDREQTSSSKPGLGGRKDS